MFNKLTIQQLCALDYNRNMVVTSGPGAGKTSILSHRFCFILLTDDRVSIPQILTLTFTEKAAEEMKGRIYDMLISLDRRLKQHGNAKLKEKIRDAKDKFDKNRISTIHSFCASLLREHPVESGIDPGFKIIQGIRQKMILDSAITDAIKSVWGENKDELIPLFRSFGGKDNLFRAVRNLSENSSLYERVLDTKEYLFNISDWKTQVFDDYCIYLRDRFLVPYLNGLKRLENNNDAARELITMLEAWYPFSKNKDEFYGVPDIFGKMRGLAEKEGKSRKRCGIDTGLIHLSYVEMVREHFPDLFLEHNPDSILEKELDYFMKAVNVSIVKYSHEKDQVNSLDFSDLETRSLLLLKNLLGQENLTGLKKIQDRYRYVMVDEFQDTSRIQWDIIRTLCIDTSKPLQNCLLPGRIFVVGDKRQAIYGFRGSDVTVFERVNREIKNSNTNPGPLFWQSGGMTTLLKDIDESYDLDIQKKRFGMLSSIDREKIMKGDIYLPHNFRSDKNPVAFFNRTFEEIFSNKHAGDTKNYETAPRDINIPEEKINNIQNRGSVTIYIPSPACEKNDQPETEAFLIVNLIESMLGKLGQKTYEFNAYQDIREKYEKNERAIGILFYAFTHIRTFENILREAGIPFVIHKGKGFYKSSEVIEMLQLLNYLADERQEISLLSCLRGQMFGLSDHEIFDIFYNRKGLTHDYSSSDNPYIRKIFNQIDSFRQLASRLTISELIRTIMLRRSLIASYSVYQRGNQSLLNLEKLMDIARRFQNEENGSLHEFVKYCLEMADKDEDEGEAVMASEVNSAISLMTIHAAKGLEFPMVILPQLDRKIFKNPEYGKPVRLYASERDVPCKWNSVEGDIPVWPVEVPSLGYRKEQGPLMHLLMYRKSLEEIAENRRVFYVGCTRAENHLVLICADNAKKTETGPITLTSDDYRQKANINQLLTDIYGLDKESVKEFSEIDNNFSPVIKRYQVKMNRFHGVDYDPEKPDSASFGIYDDHIKDLDLTEPVKSNPYFQLSFTSVHNYLKCPVRFYYSTVLKLKEGEYAMDYDDEEYLEENDTANENIDDYDTEDALFIGNFIHGYLEKHEFGKPFDENLFGQIKRRMKLVECNMDFCLERIKELLIHAVADKQLIEIIKGKTGYAEVPFLVTTLPGIEFRGVMDRIIKDTETGLWAIIDWKSNNLGEKSPEQVAAENGYDMQLAFYKWALEKILNEKVDKQYIYFLDHGHLIECSWQGNPLDIFKSISRKMEEVEKKGVWHEEFAAVRNNSAECRFCGYNKTVCL